MNGGAAQRTTNRLPLLAFAAAALLLIFLLSLFFEDFPNGAKQAGYAAWVKNGGPLPSPSMLFLLMGRILHAWLQPAAALALLACVSGVLCLPVFHLLAQVVLTEQEPFDPRRVALGAVVLTAFSYAFIRACGTQLPQTLQMLLLLAAARVAWMPHQRAPAAGGALFGLAVATHSTSLLALPAVVFAWRCGNGDAPWKALRPGLIAAAAVTAVFGIVFLLLPHAARESGSASPLPAFAGITPLLFPVALLGLLFLYRADRRAAVFWLLYAGPALACRSALPFLLPAVSFLLAVAAAGIASGIARALRPRLRSDIRAALVRRIVYAASIALLLAPSAALVVRHREDVEADRVAHYAPTTIAAMWMGENLPPDAVVIQPRAEPNANLMRYYLDGRRLVTREIVDTATLRKLLESGRPVYALESHPLDTGMEALDWIPAETACAHTPCVPFPCSLALYRATAR